MSCEYSQVVTVTITTYLRQVVHIQSIVSFFYDGAIVHQQVKSQMRQQAINHPVLM